eukprot:TRINITY_DN58245_c0_g1_i1.p1 TRINITY_DN58245_c0_g1~~TRINITY_DN58245_c0_g1_i1.p1  ORF type:complete len:263 (+),score=27.04 TRINITY_DN58245_c0_g1_i1:120-908(+)
MLSRSCLKIIVAFCVGIAVADSGGEYLSGNDAGFFRVFHASPDTLSVDILFDGSVAVRGVAFGNATPFVMIPVGKYRVSVVPCNATSPVLVSALIHVGPRTGASFVIAGLPGDLRVELWTVDVPTPQQRHCALRVAPLLPNSPPLNVSVDTSLVASSVPFPNVIPPKGHLELPEGVHHITFIASAGGDPIFRSRFSCVAGRVSTAAVVGMVTTRIPPIASGGGTHEVATIDVCPPRLVVLCDNLNGPCAVGTSDAAPAVHAL